MRKTGSMLLNMYCVSEILYTDMIEICSINIWNSVNMFLYNRKLL